MPAHEASGGAVDISRYLANRFHVVTWHPAVHGCHHAIPVEQHVEGYHRRHHEQRCHRNQRHARIPQRLENRGHQTEAGTQHRVEPVLEAGRVDAKTLLQPFRVEIGDESLQACQIIRQFFRESRHLRGQDRHQDDEGKHKNDDEGDQDHHRRHDTRQAEPFQPIGNGIEEICQHHARHEGQQNVAEQIEEADQDNGADQPEP